MLNSSRSSPLNETITESLCRDSTRPRRSPMCFPVKEKNSLASCSTCGASRVSESRVKLRSSTYRIAACPRPSDARSEEHTSELQSQSNLVCRLLLEKKKLVSSHPSEVSSQH